MTTDRITVTGSLDDLRRRIDSCRRVLVLTGAGISVASGLPTFRGVGGIYADADIERLHHTEHLDEQLDALWAFWGPVRGAVARAQPNDGHLAVARWMSAADGAGRDVTLVTQNVDDLHERAGSRDVAHLHGRVFATRCTACGFTSSDDRSEPAAAPICPGCGGRLRPGMVLFGEPVDIDAEWTAKRAVRSCDLLLAVGTVGAVSSASRLLRYARDVDALTVCVDPAPETHPTVDVHVQLPAELALPDLLR
jgi:NAD-dependent deacetylase